MLAKPSDGRRALDNWARDEGYSDFDTYVRGGGSILAARQDIERRIERLQTARRWLGDRTVVEPASATGPGGVVVTHGPTIGPEALARLEAETAGEQPDPANAHRQGDDHV
jgi:hypothetical protein